MIGDPQKSKTREPVNSKDNEMREEAITLCIGKEVLCPIEM